MRACMVAYTFYETDNRVRRYAETLVKRGDQVEAIVLRRPGQSPFEVIRGVHVYRIQPRIIDETNPFTYLVKLLLFFWRSARMLTLHHWKQSYDLIHVHSVPDFEVFSTLVPRILGAKVIIDIHDIVPELYASKFKITKQSPLFRLLVFMEWISVRYAHHVIIANHLWHERLVSRSARAEHCTTILNYPDLSIFCERQNRPEKAPGDFVLFYPGTLSWHQGVDLILQAIARLGERAPNLKLVVVGDGPEQNNLLQLVHSLGLDKRVAIGEGVALEKVAEAMSAADLGIEPKRKSTFGNEALSTKIFEFMAMRVPVLASDTAINRRYFGNGLVEFFPSEDVEGLANAIYQLMQDPAKLAHLREGGLHHIERNNWTVKMHEYLSLTNRLVSAASRTKRTQPRSPKVSTPGITRI